MMEGGLPDQKRPRLAAPDWPTSAAHSPRHLPLPPPAPPSSYSQHNLPYSHPTGPPPQYPQDRRPPIDHAQYEHHHQDLRRPNSGPSHGYYPPPSSQPYTVSREPLVKRDPSDDPPLAPQYRPSSTGNGTDHNVTPSPHHEAPSRPQQYDPARPQIFQQQQQQQQQPNSFPPTPSPMSAPDQYNGYQHNGLPGTRDQGFSVTYPAPRTEQQNQVKRKAQRAAQACDSCRTLKAKCDEGRPSCTSCKEKNAVCSYRDPPPKQQDKQTESIIDSINDLRNMITTKFEYLQTEINAIRSSHQMPTSNAQPSEPILKREIEEPNKQSMAPYSRPSVGSEAHTFRSADSPYSSSSGHQRVPDRNEQSEPYPPYSRQAERMEKPEMRVPPVPPQAQALEDGASKIVDPEASAPPGVSTMPLNHTTGAARLLLVGPIREMCKDIIKHPKIVDEMFPIVTEDRRGCLRLYGNGEGHDTIPGYDKDPITDHMNSPGDSPMNMPSPDEEWGQVGGFTPPANVDFPHRELTRGDINSIGMPDLSRATVYKWVNYYKENINIMHPILSPRQLDNLMELFLKGLPESQVRPKQVTSLSAGFVGGGYHAESPSNKRKRSPASGDFPEIISVADCKPGHPFRNMTTCIVLLCMALGKISQHHEKIKDYDEEAERETDESLVSSPVYRNGGYPQSPLHSSSSMPTPAGMGSPQDMERNRSRSRRASIDGPHIPRTSSMRARNIDRVPGLSYYAIASDIIGNQLGGNGLQHVHANILAGLYQGQLARVMESHAYITAACRSLQVMLRVKIDRFKTYKRDYQLPPAQDNPLIFAFWTCLQLESDILAELPCPHSGILTYEEDMPHPNMKAACEMDGFDERVIESYSAQLFLRKHLNSLHNMFYKPNTDPLFPPGKTLEYFPTIVASEQNVDSVRDFAPHMTWNMDDGEPADDILGARLRAKYYGAQVITYRPFLLKILKGSAPGDMTNDFIPQVTVPDIPEDLSIGRIDPPVLEYASKGIRALIHSTRAFHAIGPPWKKRLIVTNIWGTAHAQWGNMLVLQAAYMNPILKPLLLQHISVEALQALFAHTISFLKLVASPSSALATDYKILEYTGSRSGLYNVPPDTASSFGSTSDTPMAGH